VALYTGQETHYKIIIEDTMHGTCAKLQFLTGKMIDNEHPEQKKYEYIS
jgi:hypothetical protein